MFFQDIEDDNIIAMEAMSYKNNSSLANDLIKVFSDAIEYRDSLRAQNLEGKEIVSRMVKYTEKDLSPKFKSAVLKNTNIIIKKLHINYMSIATGNYAVVFAQDLSFQGICAYIEILNTTMKEGTFKNPESDKLLLDYLYMGKDLNVLEGKFTTFKFPSGKNMQVEMFFDLCSAFLVKEMFSTKLEELTAEELAATMIHEIGHVITAAEEFGKFYCAKELLARNFTYNYNRSKNKQEIINTLKDKKSALDTIETKLGYSEQKNTKDATEKYIIDIVRSLILIIDYVMEELLADTRGIDDSGVVTIGSYIFGFISGLVNIINSAFYMLMMYISGITFTKWIIDIKSSLNMSLKPGESSSDRLMTYRDAFEMERRADEFVARNGLGSYVVSGLDKAYKIGGFANTAGHLSSKTARNSTMFVAISSFYTAMFRIFMSNKVVCFPYESLVNRFTRVNEDILGAFKDLNMPKEAFEQYEAELKRTQKIIEDNKKTIAYKLGKTLELFTEILNPVRTLSVLANAKLTQDYERLFDNLDKLANTELYYQSQKLNQLAAFKK